MKKGQTVYRFVNNSGFINGEKGASDIFETPGYWKGSLEEAKEIIESSPEIYSKYRVWYQKATLVKADPWGHHEVENIQNL